ncbi:retrovirus-related pol polyprotein from transposon TNT 1-94 [Tanacetum coccineum]
MPSYVSRLATGYHLESLLEKSIQGIVLDRENTRFKLVETQKVAKDLSSIVKLLEDFIQSRIDGPDTIQERGVFESPLTAESEISKFPVGKVGLPLVPYAAQMRSLRKGSNDQLAITIDSESDCLLDKGSISHMFKSLNTSGLVPVQGKMIADRLDGICEYYIFLGFVFCQCIKMATIGLKAAASVSCESVSSFLGKERTAPLRHSSSKRPQFVPNVLKCAPAGKWTRDWLFSDKVTSHATDLEEVMMVGEALRCGELMIYFGLLDTSFSNIMFNVLLCACSVHGNVVGRDLCDIVCGVGLNVSPNRRCIRQSNSVPLRDQGLQVPEVAGVGPSVSPKRRCVGQSYSVPCRDQGLQIHEVPGPQSLLQSISAGGVNGHSNSISGNHDNAVQAANTGTSSKWQSGSDIQCQSSSSASRTCKEILSQKKEKEKLGPLCLWLYQKSSLLKFHKRTDAKENTNDVSTAYSVSNPSGQNSQYEQTSSYSLLANQSSCPQLDHEDLEQLDEYDLEEMDLKWQVAMISMRMKKFYKKTGRKLQFDAKEPVGFDKTKVECYNCHKTGHFARECRTKGNQDSRRRDAWNSGNKDGRRSEEEEDYALMACNSSGSDTEVTSCSNECKESYAKLKKLYDAQREQLSDASIEIKAYTQGLKKVEAQLVAHQQGQLWYIWKMYLKRKKVWSDAPIIEEYGSDSEDEYVSLPTKEHKLTRTGKIPVNTARASGTNKVSTARHAFNRQAVPINAAMKVNTVKPIVNRVRPTTIFHKTHLPFSRPFNNTTTLRTNFSKQKVNTAKDYPHRAYRTKGIFDSGMFQAHAETRALLLNIKTINVALLPFGGSKGIKREYSNARTPQQNGVAERKNRTLIEAARTMLAYSFLPNTFSAEAVSTACYVLNIGIKLTNMQCPQDANHNAGTQDKIDAVKRSTTKDACEAPNKHPDLKTDEKPVDKEDQVFLDELERLKRQEKDANDAAEALRKEFAQETENLLLQAGAAKASSTNIVNTVSTPVSTASPYGGLSFTDPTNPDQDDSEIPALEDIYQNPTDGIFTNSSYDDEDPQTTVLQEEIEQKVLEPMLLKNAWQFQEFSESLDSCRFVLWEEDYDEVFAPAVRIEAIRIFLAFASYMGFIVYQMDVKSAFLYGKIDEEVYVSQPPGFLDPKYPQKVYKVVKALYGLHQAPRAWYATLSTFLLKNGYRRGTIDKTLFIKKDKHDIILVQVYVDDIIFGSTKEILVD